jgi:hypothetical protein
MRKIKEALRLKFELGLGHRQIARSCSIGVATVHEYLSRIGVVPAEKDRLVLHWAATRR